MTIGGALKRKATFSPATSDSESEELPFDDARRSLSPVERAGSATLAQQTSALQILPHHVLEEFFPAQKRRCLDVFSGQLPPGNTISGKECVGMEEEWHTLHTMLHATVTAQESNSCLLIGSSGAGKSLLLDSVLRSIRSSTVKSGDDTEAFYQVTLTGSVQINDRASMKEMAQQLILQGAFSEEDVGSQMIAELNEEESEDEVDGNANDFNDGQVFGGDDEEDSEDEAADDEDAVQEVLAGAILSSLNNVIAHIIALLSNASESSSEARGAKKPLIIVIEDFDLFTARPRQALLYCLLDAVQAASYAAGLAVIGVTSRVDTTDLLEKRVKSRFSHRIVHVRPPASYEMFENIVRAALAGSPPLGASAKEALFHDAWVSDVSALLALDQIKDVLRGIYELSNDLRMVYRILMVAIAQLSLTSPSPVGPACVETILRSASVEVGDGMLRVLTDLTDPELTLLIAVKHLQTRDRQIFNFEMLFDELRRFASKEARDSQAASTGKATSATVRPNNTGSLVGSAVSTPFYADRKIALLSFHSLLGLEILLPENHVTTLSISNPVVKPSAAPSSNQTGRANQNTIRKDFWKVRCVLSPSQIVQAVRDKSRPITLQASLVNWATSHG